jgi:alpha-acetolactate decarboxylase
VLPHYNPKGRIITPMGTRLAPIAFLAALGIGPTAGQSPPGANDPGEHTLRQPYELETFGMFRSLILNGDFTPKVTLREVMAKHPTTGVGAVVDARGEITIYDGKPIVSYGKEASHPTAEAELAALLAVGTVAAWQSIIVERDIAPGDIEAFLAQMATAHGLKPDASFPFQIQGTLASYVMHVNAAPTNGPHGMGQPIAISAETKGDSLVGMVAGFYVSRDLVGIVSHGGTRTHSHWVSSDGNSTAHLDRWGLRAGAILLLPKA